MQFLREGCWRSGRIKTKCSAALPVMYDRFLQGAKPVELPIEQPMRFELMLNLKSANAIDLDVAEAMLAGATEVLE
jgi:ABC-type uncharacterized transport system substrate-binding protein